MMRLYVRAVNAEDDKYRVYWSTSKIEGSGQRGVLLVTIPSHFSHPDARAETSALRHLLIRKNVFGRDPDEQGNILVSGIGLSLTLGSESAYKMAIHDGNIKHAGRSGYFLGHRLYGAVFEHSIDMTPFTEVLNETPTPIDNPSTSLDFILTPNAGLISITHHAVERYIQFVEKYENVTTLKRPRESILKRFFSDGFERVEVPHDIMVQKTINHGNADNTEFWGNKGSRIQFTIVRDEQGIGTVVTAYVPKKKIYTERKSKQPSGRQ